MARYSCDGGTFETPCTAEVEIPDYANPTIVLCPTCNGGTKAYNCIEYGVTYGPGIDDATEEG